MDSTSKLNALHSLSDALYQYIPNFIVSEPLYKPQNTKPLPDLEQSQIRVDTHSYPPDKALLYIDFKGDHAASDAMQLYQLIFANTDRAHTHVQSARPKPLTAAQRIQKIPNGSIEQRVEYITQTCLEIWMTDINYRLKQQFGDDAKLLTLNDLMPKPAAEGVERPPRIEPIQGLHGIVFGEVARCMATRKDLALPPPEVRQLQRLTELKNRTVSPQRETGILLRDFPQIGKLEKNGKPEGLGDPEALYYTLHRDVNYTLADYLNNKHLNNERPSGLGLG